MADLGWRRRGARLDLAAIRRDNPLPNIAAQLVPLRAAGGEWKACCPFHPDRTPSFTLYRDRAGDWRYRCFGCGAAGDVLDLVQCAYGIDLIEAARRLGAGVVPRIALPAAQQAASGSGRDTERAARSIWLRAAPPAGTPAEAYLRWRGIAPPYPPSLRFLALPCDNLGPLPCLVAAVQDIAGEVRGVQRIWLASDGQGKAAVPKPKRSLGRVHGGAIRLGEPGASSCLTVCEGPEDGLSLAIMLRQPVWVASGASFMPAMQLPAGLESVLIGADNDAAGLQSARAAALAFAGQGLTSRIIRPLDGYKDFNDELRGAGHEHAA